MSSYLEKLERAEQCAILPILKEPDFKLLRMTPEEFSKKPLSCQNDLIARRIGGDIACYLLGLAPYKRMEAQMPIWTRGDFIIHMFCTPEQYYGMSEHERFYYIRKVYMMQWDRAFAKSKAKYSTSRQRQLIENFRKSEVGKLVECHHSNVCQKKVFHTELLQKCVRVN